MVIWEKCTARLKEELSIAEFNTWIMPLQASEQDGVLRLFAPNRFVLDQVEMYYKEKVEALCERLTDGTIAQVLIEVGTFHNETPIEHDDRKSEHRPPRTTKRSTGRTEKVAAHVSNLNSEFTFDTFVEGKSNQIARAASLQIGNNPGRAYNPFFIYGGVGLGKTHLMHAIGNTLLSKDRSRRVVYIHSERFVADMVRALQHNQITEFKRYYRSLNALLIDDVQFFAGKERSQEEFFHTFNALFESKQQIILTSDRYPKEVSGLEERLKSRFGWGLTVSVDPPDLETRVAILQSKAAIMDVDLPDEVGFFVARRIKSNIRELEGALRRLVANAEFTGQELTVDFAKAVLRDMLIAQDKMITIDNIQKVVAEYYKIRITDLISAKRTRSISRPRQIAMTLAKELTKHSLPEIGTAFGGRDHTTVIHATKKINSLRKEEIAVEEDYKNLLRILTS
ncbi:chromosomal replication initiator protein DnaA [Thioflavicoccus mobilis 8321]|uniref:Chromosomal replication initiator protein DnaA n=1 Tax=Thioflavicoccus mobilis 8321 TaxID=765912 RepID=L0GSA5_9GAMM|nr:chromosomal replication initiator protein DnaA [Thioflavicoccus mobilis]AGA88881.1 chromosomal replication initiator protein DnaA [Thioflavicoccus mobilis 8321]